MGVLEKIRQFYGVDRKAAKMPIAAGNRPLEMIFRYAPNAAVSWYQDTGEDFIENGFMGNHVVFSLQDWKAQKVSIAPPIVYKVVNQKAYRKYKALMRSDDRRKGFRETMRIKGTALEEVESGTELHAILNKPNPHMSWAEFAYGHCVYKDLVGSSYIGATRAGADDPTKGKIKEMYLFPAHQMVIESGGITRPITKYKLSTAPDRDIDAANVLQIRNFSPDYEQPYQFLYGMSRLQSANRILQKYNEGVATEVDTYQKRGVRDIIFPKNIPDTEPPTIEQAQRIKDIFNRDLQTSGHGGIMSSNEELGSIRIGLSPKDLGIIESQKLTKEDFCALYHIPSIIMGWSDQTTYNNLSEARKIAITDAVLPELEALKEGLNSWLVPSYYPNGEYVIDFDYEYYAELQDDILDTVSWMEKANCLTTNEKRAALRYDADPNPDADRIVVSGNMKFLEDLGIDSFASEPIEEAAEGQADEQ